MRARADATELGYFDQRSPDEIERSDALRQRLIDRLIELDRACLVPRIDEQYGLASFFLGSLGLPEDVAAIAADYNGYGLPVAVFTMPPFVPPFAGPQRRLSPSATGAERFLQRSATSVSLARVRLGLVGVEHRAEPGLGRRHVEQGGGLGEPGVACSQRRQDPGVLGDRPLGCAGLDDTSPRPAAGGAAGHAIEHRGQGGVAAGSGHEVMELLVELHQFLVRRRV